MGGYTTAHGQESVLAEFACFRTTRVRVRRQTRCDAFSPRRNLLAAREPVTGRSARSRYHLLHLTHGILIGKLLATTRRRLPVYSPHAHGHQLLGLGRAKRLVVTPCPPETALPRPVDGKAVPAISPPPRGAHRPQREHGTQAGSSFLKRCCCTSACLCHCLLAGA